VRCRHWAGPLHARRAAGSGEVQQALVRQPSRSGMAVLPFWRLSLYLGGVTPGAEQTADNGSGPGEPLKHCCVEAEHVDQLAPLHVGQGVEW
jgi:hypothetical protein